MSTFQLNQKSEFERLVKRGQMYYVSHEPNFRGTREIDTKEGRPAVIISRDEDNFMSGTVMIAYFTSEKHIINMRDTQFKVSTSKIKSSVGKCEQITTVDKSCLGDYIGDLSEDDVKVLNRAILSATGITKDELKSCMPEMFENAQNNVQLKMLQEEVNKLTEENASLKEVAADAEKYKFSYNQLLSGIVGNKA